MPFKSLIFSPFSRHYIIRADISGYDVKYDYDFSLAVGLVETYCLHHLGDDRPDDGGWVEKFILVQCSV
jgi:hypothetical protein